MFARISRYQQPADTLDEAVRLGEEKIVARVESLPGFLGLQFLIDRETGQSLSITYWDSADALRASEEDADRIRTEGNNLTGATTVQVERYEVATRVGV